MPDTSMTKLYFEPITVELADGRPQTFIWRRRMHHVSAILKRWIVCADWWRQEIARQYYQVECENLGTYEIYHEQDRWVLERIYD